MQMIRVANSLVNIDAIDALEDIENAAAGIKGTKIILRSGVAMYDDRNPGEIRKAVTDAAKGFL